MLCWYVKIHLVTDIFVCRSTRIIRQLTKFRMFLLQWATMVVSEFSMCYYRYPMFFLTIYLFMPLIGTIHMSNKRILKIRFIGFYFWDFNMSSTEQYWTFWWDTTLHTILIRRMNKINYNFASLWMMPVYWRIFHMKNSISVHRDKPVGAIVLMCCPQWLSYRLLENDYIVRFFGSYFKRHFININNLEIPLWKSPFVYSCMAVTR